MIEQEKKQALKRTLRDRVLQATIFAMTALAIAPTPLRAEDSPSPNADVASRSDSTVSKKEPKQKAAEYTVTIDNSNGSYKLLFDREVFECMTDPGPPTFTVEPHGTKIFTIVDKNAAATPCFGGAKFVVWQVNTYGPTGGKVYTVDFRHQNNGFFFSKWQTMISATTGSPGTVGAATCGGHNCLNTWADQPGDSPITITMAKDD
ncbi:hypothetical protein AB1286_20490 [Trinickia sp. NRRL B-1857]|uniref:hypothetical protein n=1 Tax=Trinickia sp. NRRL B-1857 TaxID=3162879 RepID=UPI003D2E2A33